MTRKYFLGDDRNRLGPFRIDGLRAMAESGKLQASDAVFEEDLGPWRPASSVTELAELFVGQTFPYGIERHGRRERLPHHRADAITESAPLANESQAITRLGPANDDISVFNPEIDFRMVKSFRDQILALGSYWIFVGAVHLAIALTGHSLPGMPFFFGPLFFLVPPLALAQSSVAMVAGLSATGVILFALGVATCMKKIAAVYLGLGLSWLCLILLCYTCVAFSLSMAYFVLPILCCLLSMAQAQRVLGWAKKMRDAGVPYDVKP